MNDRHVNDLTSVNNRVIVEAYKKEGLKSTVSNGFASIAQKNNLKGLKVLADAQLADGTVVRRGYTVYVREETLHTAAWAAKTLEAPGIIEGPFMVMDGSHVEMVTM